MSIIKKYFWFFLAALTLLLRAFFQSFPNWTEQIYSRGIFQGVRYAIDYLLGWLPFPLVYILFGVLLWKLVAGVRYLVFKKTIPIRQRLLTTGRNLLAFLCGVIVLFHWMWGYNYSRISIEQHLSLPEITLTEADLKTALDEQTSLVLALRTQIQADSSRAIAVEFPTTQLEDAVRQDVERALQRLLYPTPGKPRGRQPFWDGFLLRFGAAGIYNPFTGECNIDRGLYFLTKPYNLAHEFCHGYGFGDEGTCNFLAYLALEKSEQPLLRYSAELDFWRELAGTYRRLQPDTYAAFRATLPAGFIADLDNIYKKMDKYPEFFAAFRYEVYDQYLKAQGIAEGMENYGKVIPLVLAYKRGEK
ncbi:MAG: DUF3810 domain-containing protein [Saprospiraceae bacterium]|nr:DUF3810 domain-containing protein [Saprospiraceae bacterium]